MVLRLVKIKDLRVVAHRMAKRSCGGFDYCILNKYYLCPYNYLRCTYIYKTTSAQKMTSISISNHTKPFRECHMREKGVSRQHHELCKKRAHLCRLRSEHIALYFKGHPLQNKNPAQEAYLAIKDHILHFETGHRVSKIFAIISCQRNYFIAFF